MFQLFLLKKCRQSTDLVDGCGAGLQGAPGLAISAFDECGVPEPDSQADRPSHFQHALSHLVQWRYDEALQAAAQGGRDILPVIVLAGTRSSRMTLVNTALGSSRILDLGVPLLSDALALVLVLEAALDIVRRIAQGVGQEVPSTAKEARASKI
jgi:hypothetical protein